MRLIIKVIMLFIMCLYISPSLIASSTFEYDSSYKVNAIGDKEEDSQVEPVSVESGFDSVAKTDNIELYLNSSNYQFAVKDITTDYVWYSNPQTTDNSLNDLFKRIVASPFNITYTNSDFKEQQASMLDEDAEVTATTSSSGIEYSISYLGGEISLKINLELTDDGFKIDIPSESVVDSDQFQLLSVSIAPYFGAVYEDEVDGYFAFPYNNGTLLRFKESESGNESFIGTTSITDYENLTFPMYGGVHGINQNAFVTYVSSDDIGTVLEAKPSGYDTSYTSTNFTMNYRTVFSKQIGESQTVKQVSEMSSINYEQQFKFIENDEANYTGIAKAYREMMIDTGLLSKENEYQYSTRLQYLMTLSDYGLFGQKSATVTTNEELDEVNQKFADAGLHTITEILGVEDLGNDDIDVSDINKEIGLISSAEDNQFNYYWNMGVLNSLSRSNRKYVQIDSTTNKPIEVRFNGDDVYPPLSTYITTHLDDLIKNVNQISNNLTIQPTYRFGFNQGDSDIDYIANSELITTALNDNNISYNLDIYQNYYPGYYKNANSFIGDFLRAGNKYTFLDESVPMTSTILAGSGALYTDALNYDNVDQSTILNLIEYDVYPTFQLIAGEQSELIDLPGASSFPSLSDEEILTNVSEIESQIYEPLSKVAGASIVNNYAVSNGVKVTEYSNGVSIYVNYNNKQALVDDVTIEPQSYVVKEAK